MAIERTCSVQTAAREAYSNVHPQVTKNLNMVFHLQPPVPHKVVQKQFKSVFDKIHHASCALRAAGEDGREVWGGDEKVHTIHLYETRAYRGRSGRPW